jgi:hypothetical protein
MRFNVFAKGSSAAHLTFLAAGSLVIVVVLHAHLHVDDAAIVYRYVERLASGDGLTYNDHERVQGFSNPLYTLLLAGAHGAGLTPEAAARALCAASYCGSVLLTYLLGLRLGGPWAGLLAGLGLLGNGFYRIQCLSGMESGPAMFLGPLAVQLLVRGSEVLGGIVLGLALLNKLDAGLLAIAITAAFVLCHRRVPWRAAVAATAAASPWFLLATFYYGSPLPNSMLVKLTQHAQETVDRWWVLRAVLGAHHQWLLLTPATLLVLRWRRSASPETFAGACLAFWWVLHAAVFSLVDLGDTYPWYLTALFPPLFILGGAGALAARGFWPVRRGRPAALTAGVLVFLLPSVLASMETVKSWSEGNPIRPWEAFDLDRRLAGIFLDLHAEKDEVVDSAFGWVAFEARRPFNDQSRLNSRTIRERVHYWVESGHPSTSGSHPPQAPEGFIPLATFDLAATLFPGYSWFTVFGRADSKAVRTGARFYKVQLPELPPLVPIGGTLGRDVRRQGTSIFAHPPSQFVLVPPRITAEKVRLRVRPGLDPQVEPRASDGVTFEVRVRGEIRFRRHVRPGEEIGVVEFDVSGDELPELMLATEVGPSGSVDFDWAWWRDVHFLIGDSMIPAARIEDEHMREAWCALNPCDPASR